MQYKPLLFPFTLALILGGLSSWLEKISTLNIEEVKLDPTQPQYLMENLTASRFDVSGSLKEHLSAQKAWQLPDQENVFLQNAQLQTFDQHAPQYTVNAGMARYHLKEKKVYFEQDVLLEKAAYQQKPTATLKTTQLTVDTVAHTAHTTQAVEFTYGQSHGRANGAFYDHKTGKLDLPNNVKAMIYDITRKN